MDLYVVGTLVPTLGCLVTKPAGISQPSLAVLWLPRYVLLQQAVRHRALLHHWSSNFLQLVVQEGLQEA